VTPDGGNVYVTSAPSGRATDAISTFVRQAISPPRQTPGTLARRRSALRRFRLFGTYDVGARWGRQALSMVGAPTSAPPGITATGYGLLYGPCVSQPGSGLCRPALEVDNFPLCSVNPASEGIPPDRLLILRGVPAAVFAPGGDFDRLELYTGRTTVVVRTDTLPEARRVVSALRTVNGRTRRARLPAPLKGVPNARPRGC
jgi:hypothetical protein